MFNSIKKDYRINEIIIILSFLYLGMIYFSYAISNILLGILSGVFLFGIISKQITLEFNKSNWIKYILVATPFILTFISVLFSNDFILAQKHLVIRLPILWIPFVIIFTKFETQSIKKGAFIFVFATIIAALITCYNAIKYFNEDILFITDFAHFIAIIQHPYFGIYVLTALVLLLELDVLKHKVLKTLICVLFVSAIVLTTSRLAYILTLAYSAYYLYQSLSKKWFISISVLCTILIAFFLSTNQKVAHKFESMVDYDKSPRLQLWNNALIVIETQNAYLFGIGIGDYYKTKKDPYFAKGRDTGTLGLNPHSQYLEYYITNGIIGILILIFTTIILAIYMKQQNEFAVFLVVMVFLFSLIECIFNRQFGVQLYVVLIPLLLKPNFKKLQHEL